MKLDCCGGIEKALGVLLFAASFLIGCTNDGESLAAPSSETQSELS
jgi:hypothetical protein